MSLSKDKMIELFKNSGFSSVLYDEPVKNHSELEVGGRVDVMVIPKDVDELVDVVKFCRSNDIVFFIMGRGSSLLLDDVPISGVFIKIDKHISNIRSEDDILKVQPGAYMEDLIQYTKENDILGLSHLKDVPASIGGAVATNAEVAGIDMKNYVRRVEVLDKDNEIKILTNKEMNFGYRKSRVIDEELIILDIEFNLAKI